MDYFSPTFSEFLNLKLDLVTEVKNLNFLISGLRQIVSSPACLSGLQMGINVVCTL